MELINQGDFFRLLTKLEYCASQAKIAEKLAEVSNQLLDERNVEKKISKTITQNDGTQQENGYKISTLWDGNKNDFFEAFYDKFFSNYFTEEKESRKQIKKIQDYLAANGLSDGWNPKEGEETDSKSYMLHLIETAFENRTKAERLSLALTSSPSNVSIRVLQDASEKAKEFYDYMLSLFLRVGAKENDYLSLMNNLSQLYRDRLICGDEKYITFERYDQIKTQLAILILKPNGEYVFWFQKFQDKNFKRLAYQYEAVLDLVSFSHETPLMGPSHFIPVDESFTLDTEIDTISKALINLMDGFILNSCSKTINKNSIDMGFISY